QRQAAVQRGGAGGEVTLRDEHRAARGMHGHHADRVMRVCEYALHLVGDLAGTSQLAAGPEVSTEAERTVEQLRRVPAAAADLVRALERRGGVDRTIALHEPDCGAEADVQPELPVRALRRVGELGQEIDRARQMGASLRVSGTLHRAMPGVLAI